MMAHSIGSVHQFIGHTDAPSARCFFLVLYVMESFKAFLTNRGCPGSSRDLTKVLVWLQAGDVSCPEDLKHLRKLSTFSGVDRFQCDIIAFINALIGKGIELGVPECVIVEPDPKRARIADAQYASYILAPCVIVMHRLLY